MKKTLLMLMMGLCVFGLYAQETFHTNGVRDERPQIYAFTGATIHVDHIRLIENATLLVEKGKIKAVGTSVNIPKGAVVKDLRGKHIYPAFIELYAQYGLDGKSAQPRRGRGGMPQMESSEDGAYNWNEAIKASYNASEDFTVDTKDAEAMRKLGFGAVLSHKHDGIVRGTGTLVSLAEDKENLVILKDKASTHFSFNKGTSTQDYPSSLMGSIALLRQTYLDAQWYNSQDKMFDHSLKAFNEINRLPAFFEAEDKLTVLRADKIGDEFGIRYIVRGSGDEYQIAADIKKANVPLIIPVVYPEAYDVEDPLDAANVGLDDMKHWEMATHNARILAEHGVEFAFTTNGLRDKKVFLKEVKKAIEAGLSEADAIKALTSIPAGLLGMQQQLGTLESGKLANFIITSGSPFEDKTTLYENWVQGRPFIMHDTDQHDLRGNWELKIANKNYTMEVSGELEKQAFKIIINDSTKLDVKSKINRSLITLSFAGKDEDGKTRLSGSIHGQELNGTGELPNGNEVKWSAQYKSALEDTDEKEKDNEKDEKEGIGKLIYPFVAYGNTEKPIAETILIKNTTVWTNEAEGKLENTDVLIKDGKIAQVGKNISASGVREINGTGKHLTPGIIDEHSHIAISRGVNESAQSSTIEVRIQDVINSEDINIYRQLSGGVVASQLLHGSANAIGGQAAFIKLKWGYSPEEMHAKWAAPFVKFALGENVKQSNWGDMRTVRFPQTRMGVEQVFEDAFTRAREYDEQWKAYNGLAKKAKATATPPRRDLELEALAEILNGTRFISCHSYVQSEINMLIKVAERHNFTVNTFTHILEGYKVADKMAAHGVGGSTFADWWAYKMEVQDAIPYNANLMHNQGVTTAINSDDAEMGRRLNQEAAKSIKYGGMSEQDALKMVTLNPAKLLRVDNRMGSIKVGKDADVVLWTDHPLSVYAKAEKTIIEGIVFFDLDKDEEVQKTIQEERARLIRKMNGEKKAGKPTRRPSPRYYHQWECEHIMHQY